jgi:fatty-acyl-CoA synthase
MLTGYGDIPVEEAVSELAAIGYDGFLSYEWVKRWSRELAEPGVAFYQYISYMNSLGL